MKKTYSWTGKNGRDITLAMTAETSMLRDSMEIEFTAECLGGKFSCRPCSKESIKGEITVHGWLDGEETDVRVMLPTDIEAGIHADLDAAYEDFQRDFWHGKHFYIVHDTTAYGIYNGFGLAVERMIKEVISRLDPDDAAELRFNQDALREIMRVINDQFADQAQDTYTPYQANEDWPDEYKQAYQASVEARTAHGKAEIPAEEISGAIEQIVRKMITDTVPGIIKRIEGDLRRAKDISDDQARAEERRYSEIQNEGGYGYVPHIIGRGEAEYLRKQLAALRRLVG